MVGTIVKTPYSTSPHMDKYEGELLFPHSQSIIDEKKIELDFHSKISPPGYHNLWFQSDIAHHHKLVYKLSKLLNVGPVYSIVDLGTLINEDVAVLHNGRLEACFFAFPSGWNPGNKQGLTLEQLHRPVGDGEMLRKMSSKLAQLMSGKYKYTRWVWTVSPTSNRSNHPVYTFDQPDGIEDLWWRTERQVSLPIEENVSSAFLVNVFTVKFDVLTKYDQMLIRDSINTMSDNILDYKNLRKIKSIINNALTVGDVYVNARNTLE